MLAHYPHACFLKDNARQDSFRAGSHAAILATHSTGIFGGIDDSVRTSDTGRMALFDFIAMVRRGFFAGLIAMAVVASGSAHATITGIEDGAATQQASQPSAGHGHHAASSKQAASHTKSGSHQPDGKADGTMCKVQCAFSMILPLSYDGAAAHGQNVWAFSPAIAVLPGEIVPDLRPPRA